DVTRLYFPRVEKSDAVFVYTTGVSKRYLVMINNSAQEQRVHFSSDVFLYFFDLNEKSDLLVYKNIIANQEEIRTKKECVEKGAVFFLQPYASCVLTHFTTRAETVRDNYPRIGDYLAGVAAPVCALRSQQSCAIGEFYDLKILIDWCVATGQRIINLLPVNDTGYNSSPYSALSAMALHPVYLSLDNFPLCDDLRQRVEAEKKRTRAFSRVIFYDIVRFKEDILQEHYNAAPDAAMEDVPHNFKNQEWVRDYAIFRILKKECNGNAWFNWEKHTATEEILRLIENPTATARQHFFEKNQREANFYIWVQYQLDLQLSQVRDYARERGVFLKGDIPILLERDSVDVWLNPHLFNSQLRAGAPPDMFSPDGQNWGFPIYAWNEHAKENFAWWRARIRQMARYFAAYRIDHVLGFFRIWAIDENNTTGIDGFFVPSYALAREDFYALEVSDVSLALLSRVRLYEHELELIRAAGNESVESIDGLHFLSHAYAHERGIHALRLEENFTHELLRRLHTRAFLEYEKKFYPLWDFEKRLWHICDIDDSLRIRIQEKIRVLKTSEADEQRGHGRKILSVLKEESGMLPCAEDLGVVPDYVRPTLEALQILCLKVYRWEAENNIPKDPKSYPYLSLATSSVHDSSNLREWLMTEPSSLTGIEIHNGKVSAQNVYDFLARLYASPSMITMVPLQDLLALDGSLHGDAIEERINIPGTVSDFNWTYRMPITLEELLQNTALCEKIKNLALLKNSHRE
ncbi:MAG TPA: 4-alpha-glucanotransferase, partial [Turneriella sp.]|nr:4-alpha-glucanotransferase [Turneriella sp.]